MPIAVGEVWGSTLGVGLDAGSWGAHKGPNQVTLRYVDSMCDVRPSRCLAFDDLSHRPPVPSLAQAGNKSLWGFRSDIGVPGYTGYCPTHLSIKVPHKGCDHTGRPVDSTFKDSIVTATVDPGVLQVSE